MNFITCAALLCLHIDWISNDKRVVFAVSGLTVATLFKKEVKKDAEKQNPAVQEFEKEGLLAENA